MTAEWAQGTVYVCPVDDCGREFPTAKKLQGHMAGTMQSDPDHRWENVPISHGDLSAARQDVPGLTFENGGEGSP